MKTLADIDRLILDLAEEATSGQSDEYARDLMAEACGVLNSNRLQCQMSKAVGLVLDQARKICHLQFPTLSMMSVLRERDQALYEAVRDRGEVPEGDYGAACAEFSKWKACAEVEGTRVVELALVLKAIVNLEEQGGVTDALFAERVLDMAQGWVRCLEVQPASERKAAPPDTYPTEEAYDAVCAARTKWQLCAEDEGARVVELALVLKSIVGLEGQHGMSVALFAERALGLAQDGLRCQEGQEVSKRPTPEDLAVTIVNNCGLSTIDFAKKYIAKVIRKDRLFKGDR